MRSTALVVMAAGIGSRYGKGIKQLEPVGPSGEIIMDYSVHDALEAGFDKIIFIIRRDLEKDFRSIIGGRIEKIANVEYAFQERDDLPAGFTCPEERVKPWGTGQAVLACRDLIREPFAVINADDYYGKEAFRKVHAYLSEAEDGGSRMEMCMAGFVLGNTLSENGAVTRGICSVDASGFLSGVTETRNIVKTPQGAAVSGPDGTLQPVDTSGLVSMNMWGLPPEFIGVLAEGFEEFLRSGGRDDLKSEYLLPVIIDALIRQDRARVAVLKTEDSWFGVTYQEDKYAVKAAFEKLIRDGVYTSPLR